jgi:hypothetical protein
LAPGVLASREGGAPMCLLRVPLAKRDARLKDVGARIRLLRVRLPNIGTRLPNIRARLPDIGTVPNLVADIDEALNVFKPPRR